MPTRVQLPNGSVGEFPDGMSQEDISGVLQKQFPAPVQPGEHGMGTMKDTLGEVGNSLTGMAKGVGKIFSGGPESIPQNLGHALVDPSVQEWNTPSQKGVMIGGTGHPTLDKAMRSVPVVGPMTANADRINQEEGFGPAAANLITPVAAGEVGGGLLKAFAEPASRAGLGLGNDALGAVGPKAFKYGQNAARGAYEEGALPAFTKHGAAMNVENALPKVGENISNAVMGSPNRVALSDIAKSINNPLSEARGIIEGPGGANRSTAPIDALQESMTRRAPGARAPIYGPNAGTAYTPDEALSHVFAKAKQPLLPAPMEEVPLHEQPFTPGETSQPITLNNPARSMRPALPSPRNVSEEIPLVEIPGKEPSMSPMAFLAKIRRGFDKRTGIPEAGSIPGAMEESGTPAFNTGGRFSYGKPNPQYLSGSEHPELSGQLPVSQGILRRFEPGPSGEAPGMSQHQSIGEIPGNYGGRQPLQGTMLRRAQFPASSEPSGLTDLRHPEATAPDIWRTIQNVDKNTRFNPDPEVEGVNELRRSVRGGLRSNLEDAVPGLKPSTQRYADLKQAQESLDKTMHGGINLSHAFEAAKFPLQTAVGRGLYTGGKMAQGFSPMLSKAFPAVYAATQRKDQ
jgi:hypothetical protein